MRGSITRRHAEKDRLNDIRRKALLHHSAMDSGGSSISTQKCKVGNTVDVPAICIFAREEDTCRIPKLNDAVVPLL